jgi:hypothetical protein
MRISPIGIANVAYWAGAKAEACLRAEGGNITSICRLPPHAVVADAGAGCLWVRMYIMYMQRDGYHEDSLIGIGKCMWVVLHSSLYILESHHGALHH